METGGGRMVKRLVIFCFFCLWLLMGTQAQAQGRFDYPFIELSPDGKAWTVREALPDPKDALNHLNPSCWYQDGETVVVGNRNEEAQPGTGEHFYNYLRQGLVPVWKWVVVHAKARCIHNEESAFHGIMAGGKRCLSSYYSGWHAICADCGEPINRFNVYLSRSKVSAIRTLDVDLDYYYLCPTCEHMEQGIRTRHECRAVSPNRYQVKYLPNAGNASGWMQSSFHVYDNADSFEGESVTPQKNLNVNTFSRRGYRFLEWNRERDGSGEGFADGQEILNLTDENYDPEKGTGIVELYARWIKVTGTLLIDPGKGAWFGKSEVASIQADYGDPYYLSADAVTPPQGYRVHFDVMGGKPLEDAIGKTYLEGWRLNSPARGSLVENAYTFWGEDGEKDMVTALYQSEEILLPRPVREGYSFGGWYVDRECTRLVGREGDAFTPSGDTVLYANWVDLVLDAKLNFQCYEGKGAVDLSWRQEDARQKSYLVYQRKEGEAFHVIREASQTSKLPEEVCFMAEEDEAKYEIPLSGFYYLEAYGGQGSDFGPYLGGFGGKVAGKFYLEAGDVITIRTGEGSGTGKSFDGAAPLKGGGATTITSAKMGKLLVAGGGGSASPGCNGGRGGSEDGLREDGQSNGGDGDVGGGAGYVGGTAGTYRKHVHVESCIHVHSGNLLNGGDCYKEVKEIKSCKMAVRGPYIEWNRSDNCLTCIANGRNGYGTVHPKCWWIVHEDCGGATDYGSHGWWECLTCGHVGYAWGSGTHKPSVGEHVYELRHYELNCDRSYDCGNPGPVILPSYGGSNYVNRELAATYVSEAGVEQGEGRGVLKPLSVGFQETCEWKEVYAPDLAPPMAVDERTMEISGGDRALRLNFREPSDRGTVYYHQVESYLERAEERLSASNVTTTMVTSGIHGYYYRIDEKKVNVVTEENADNAGTPLTKPCIEIELKEGEGKYLHLAPVDRAGNVGESISVSLSGESAQVPWEIVTAPMGISSLVEGKDYGSTYPSGENVYFVKADGRTPFLLSFSAKILGPARDNYQIDRMTYVSKRPGGLEEGRHVSCLPRGSIAEENVELSSDDVRRLTSMQGVLQGGMYAKVERKERLSVAEISQSFTMDVGGHGKQLRVIPSACVLSESGEKHSDAALDEQNGVWLIGDGEAPYFEGWDGLERAFRRFYEGEEGVTLEVCAADALSGLKELWLEVSQGNTGDYRVFYGDQNGMLRIDLSENEYLFSGDVSLIIHAADHVGNVAVLEYSTKEFDLKTEIVRLLVPHDPCFKRGESGVLRITVRGYPEELEVTFPPAFTAFDPSLDRKILYGTPVETVFEEVTFMVPLALEEDDAYQVIVKARKGSEVLVGRPELTTMQVTDSVLGEIRTRLR